MAPLAMRTHTKSRTGCKTCRGRKVKCDETAPICSNCSKRGIECIWETPKFFPTTPTPSTTPATSTELVSSHIAPEPSRCVFDACSSALDFMALELMHHYTESACHTVFQHPDLLHIWKNVVPSVAFTSNCPFLLHSLLSFSALHLYHLYGSNSSAAKYAYAAATYQAQAEKMVPKLPQLVSSANPTVVYITNSFMMLYGFTSCDGSVWAQSEWINQLRSTPEQARSRHTAYKENDLTPLTNVFIHIHSVLRNLPTDMEGFPHSLATIHLPVPNDPDPAELADPVIANLYKKAVADLRLTWTISLYSDYHSYAAFFWLVNAPSAFMDLLWERRPRALILAGHYCAIMRRINSLWWIQKDWAAEISKIEAHVSEQWRDWMDWMPPDATGLGGLDDDTDIYAWLSSEALADFSSTS